jgi:hypothetical protein
MGTNTTKSAGTKIDATVIELRTQTGHFFAAVIPDQCGKRSTALRFVEDPGECKVVAAERHPLAGDVDRGRGNSVLSPNVGYDQASKHRERRAAKPSDEIVPRHGNNQR